MDQNKRDFRDLKRVLKQKGGKRRRAHLKRQLDRDPDGAAEADTHFDFGRSASSEYNGMDSDATRKRPQ